MPALRRSPWLRRLCLALAACFVWSFALSSVAMAASAEKQAHPGFGRPKPLPVPTTLADRPYAAPFRSAPPPQVAAGTGFAPGPLASLTLLGDGGSLLRPVTPARAAEWQRELRAHPAALRAAALRLWRGEWLLAHDEQPGLARREWRQAVALARRAALVPADRPQARRVLGLCAYDAAYSLYRQGAFAEAQGAFRALLGAHARPGYDVRTCALWLRHAQACADLHAAHAKLGIPEPTRLDPLCGAAALAACLKPLGLPSTKAAVLAHCRVTGVGSDLQDVLDAAGRMGASARAVTADEAGLRALPKPLVAFVETDHFVAVTRADNTGVSYLCSDCGAWPGGEVRLTWRQWRVMNPGVYGVVVAKGGSWDRALAATLPGGPAVGVKVATAGSLRGLLAPAWLRLMGAGGLLSLRRHVLGYMPTTFTGCAGKANAPHCKPPVKCPKDAGGPGCGGNKPGGGTGGGNKPGKGKGPGGRTLLQAKEAGPSSGDPVNLATGEEEYTPPADLTVYNPHGPSVSWGRLYNSLRAEIFPSGFGVGWSDPYNVYVQSASPSDPKAFGVVMPNGSTLGFELNLVPSASQPHATATVEPGAPMIAVADYNATTGKTSFTVTWADRAKWVFAQPTVTPTVMMLSQIADRNGNAVNLAYIYATSSFPAVLSTITDAATGTVLLTLNWATHFGFVTGITSVSDCYGRSVYYAGQTQTNSELLLTGVSEVVPTGTANAVTSYNRYSYGYVSYNNPEGAANPYLNAITVPSPTGTGTSTSTIAYNPTTQVVASLTDGDGNTRTYTAGTGSTTQVTVAHGGVTAYAYTAGWDGNMSQTSRTDGAGNALATVNSFSAADPYRPASVTDGNGKTTAYTWDGFGNLLTVTPPSNGVRTPAATTYTYSYANFALGELTQEQTGTKSPTKYAYYEPNGLTQTVTSPLPGTVGSASTVATSYTYDGLGNVLTVAAPGNNAATTITTTYNYTTDGTYSQSDAVGQPLTVTNNLGKVTHFRYDSRGNKLSDVDALGNETDQTYNIADQPLQTTFPATGQQGSGHSVSLSAYLYPGGPLTGTASYDESGSSIRQVSYTYGKEGEALSVSGSAEPVTYTYDALYRLSTLTDGGGHATHYYYKQQGYLDAITYPGYTGPTPVYSSGTDDYSNITGADNLRLPTYDADGNALKRLDGNGVETDYTHSSDPESRLTLTHYIYPVGYTGGTAGDVALHYDAYGRRDQMADEVSGAISGGTVSAPGVAYSYDDLDNPLSVTTTYTGLSAKSVSYAYWPGGSRETMSTPAGSFSYTYDAVGRMLGLTNPLSESSSWTYLDNGWLWKQTLGDGAVTASTYNARGLVTDLQTKTSGGTTLSDFSGQVYNGAGDRTAVTASLPAAPTGYSGTTGYTYDYGQTANPALNRSQLTQEQSTRNGGYTNAFSYDGGIGTGAGNPTGFKGASRSYNADNQNSANTYDGDGSPTTYGGTALAFDPEGRMMAYGSALTCGYTGDGLRAWKQNSGGRTYFLYDGDETVCELSGTGAVTATDTIGNNGLLSRSAGGSSAFYTFDPSGGVAQRLDASGAVLSSDLYDGFGARQSTGGADVFRFGAQWGYYTDAETGLVLCTHRLYDPAAGRWLTRDPIGYDGGVNLYGYVKNNPANIADPSGYDTGWANDPYEGPWGPWGPGAGMNPPVGAPLLPGACGGDNPCEVDNGVLVPIHVNDGDSGLPAHYIPGIGLVPDQNPPCRANLSGVITPDRVFRATHGMRPF